MTQVEQLRLLAQCALADNRQAFGKLVEEYQPRIRRLLLNLTQGNTDLTDDLAQETFLKAYVAVRGFRGLSSFSTWLYRIAYNEFYTAMRTERPTVSLDDPEAANRFADETVEDFEARDTLKFSMDSLSDTERAVITLFYVDDLPIKKIATICSLPEGTVKSHLHRAKQKMQAAIPH